MPARKKKRTHTSSYVRTHAPQRLPWLPRLSKLFPRTATVNLPPSCLFSQLGMRWRIEPPSVAEYSAPLLVPDYVRNMFFLL
jgi:hypothetical protein